MKIEFSRNTLNTLIRLDPRLRETKPLGCASGREASGGWENVWRIPGAKKDGNKKHETWIRLSISAYHPLS